MFDHQELQVLISGALVPVDIADLKHHTNYSGKYSIRGDNLYFKHDIFRHMLKL